jgi:antitoxin component YwqK of YwqJK toxin-antitoxin module
LADYYESGHLHRIADWSVSDNAAETKRYYDGGANLS